MAHSILQLFFFLRQIAFGLCKWNAKLLYAAALLRCHVLFILHFVVATWNGNAPSLLVLDLIIIAMASVIGCSSSWEKFSYFREILCANFCIHHLYLHCVCFNGSAIAVFNHFRLVAIQLLFKTYWKIPESCTFTSVRRHISYHAAFWT